MKQAFLQLPQPVKFLVVGLLNTGIDFGLFFIFTSVFTMHFFFANLLSTGAALIVSFILNAQLTFNNRMTRANVSLFLIVTLTGLWLLQPIIIAAAQPIISFILQPAQNSVFILLLAKAVATTATLVWNYFLYKNIVFRAKESL